MPVLGAYYDPETDLFENWHRFYDPTTGRYLEPDPVWRYPEMLVPRMTAGRFDPVYAYAGNNPLGAVDPTGRIIGITDNSLVAGGANSDAALNAMIDEAIANPDSPLHEAAMSDTLVQFNSQGDGAVSGNQLANTASRPGSSGIMVNFRSVVFSGETLFQKDQFGQSHSATGGTVFAHELGHAAALLEGMGRFDMGYFNGRAIQLDNAERRAEGIGDYLDPSYGHPSESRGPSLPVPASDPSMLPPSWGER